MGERKNLGVVQKDQVEVIGKEVIAGSGIQQFLRPESRSNSPHENVRGIYREGRDTQQNVVWRFELLHSVTKIMGTHRRQENSGLSTWYTLTSKITRNV